MPLTRLELKNRIKSTRGLTRDREDGLLDDTLIHEAIKESILKIGIDCSILQTEQPFPLVAGQHLYPMPDNVHELRSLWWIDNSGNKQPVHSIDQESMMYGRNPETDVGNQPAQFSYPLRQRQVIEMLGLMRPNKDFIENSNITAGYIRTIEDAAINLGITLSGYRISPGDVVHNITRKSYGYIEVLDTITSKDSGTAQAGTTSTTLAVDGATNLIALGVKEGDMIFTPATGTPTSYAVITSVNTTSVTYEAIRGSATEFSSGDAYKIGIGNRVRISTAAPHRGLRDGTAFTFALGAVTATMTGTTITDTRCTGSSPSGAAVGEVAFSPGNSHGKITSIGDDYIVVKGWIGGTPGSGVDITIRASDEYRIETRPKIEDVLWLRPTPTTSDDAGTRSMLMIFIQKPFIPTEDWQYIDIDDRYRIALYKCCDWQAASLAGSLPLARIEEFQNSYEREIIRLLGDQNNTPIGEIMTPMGNRLRTTRGSRYTTASGITYNVSNLLNN